MALIVVDASVVIAYLDPADTHHARVDTALRERAGEDLRLPASAYAEALVDAVRQRQLEPMRRVIHAFFSSIEPIADAAAEAAAALRAQHRTLRLPDALVLGCAEAIRADEVLTTDRRWRRFPRVTVV